MAKRGSRIKIGAFVVLVLGVGLLVPATMSFVATLSFVLGAEKADAAFKGAESRNTSYGMTYFPRLEFTAKDGRDVTFTSKFGSGIQPYKEGQKIAVLYNPDRPSEVKIDSAFDLWLGPFVLGAPALLLVTTALILLFVRSRHLQEELTLLDMD